MKISKKMLSIILAIMMIVTIVPITASAATSGTCGDDLTWSYDTSTYTLTISGTGAMEDYGTDNRPWESYEDSIKKVVIGNGVASISEYAFYDCYYITDVTVAYTVKFIGAHAFYECYSLKNINIPNSVKLISDYAFYNCDALTSLTIPDSVMSIGNGAFYDCDGFTSFVIPDSVVSLGSSVFSNCSNLKSITIGDSVTTIGNSAFYNCTSLTSVTIPDSVTSIGYDAFKNCTSLTSVTIGDSVTSIGMMAFLNCINLKRVIIGNNVASIDDWAFYNCENLTSIMIPDNVTSIGHYAFYDCSKMSSLIIGDNVSLIGSYAFSNCNSLTSVTIPDNVISISNNAFSNCISLKSVIIGKGVVSMDALEYYHYKNENAYGFYGYVFSGCSSLEAITVDEKNQYYSSDEYGALFNKDKTNLYVYPAGNERTTYSIPDTVTTVADEAFANAKNLIEVSIPDSVHNLGYNNYYTWWSSFTLSNPSSFSCFSDYRSGFGYIFLNCSSLKSITIPNGVENIYQYTFDGCTALEEITIPDSVKKIYAYAFKDCLELSDVYYTDTEENWNKIDIDSHNEWLIVATKHFEDSHSHSFDAWKTTTGGCGTITQTRTCSICGYEETQTTEGSHNFTEWRYDYGTCGVDGREYRYCYNCYTYEYRDLTEHKFTNWYVAQGSCGNMGQEYRYCTICDIYEYCDTEMIEHSFGDWKVTKDATCTSTGVEMAYCSKCGGAQQRDIPATGHEYTSVVTAPTCSDQGYTTYTCSICKDSYIGDYVDAKGHSCTWYTISTATCETDGMLFGKCSVCETMDVQITPKTGHNYVDGVCVNCTGGSSNDNPTANSPVIKVSSINGAAGGQVKVKLSLENNPGVTSVILNVNFDTSKLQLVSVEDCGNLGVAEHSNGLVSPYVLCWANDTATENIAYNGDVAILTFKILDDAELGDTPVTVTYDFDNCDIVDKDMNPVKFQVENGKVGIIDVIIGDVNNDGRVNQLDRTVLTRYLAKWVEYPEGSINSIAADTNCDGKVNQLDRIILTRHLAGWEGYEQIPYVS